MLLLWIGALCLEFYRAFKAHWQLSSNHKVALFVLCPVMILTSSVDYRRRRAQKKALA